MGLGRNRRLIAACLLALLSGASRAEVRASAPSPRIQWLHADGHVLDVNWRSGSRWVWEDSREGRPSPKLELSVSPPRQVRIIGSDDPRVVVIKDPGSDGHASLVLEGKYPAFTARIYVDSGDGAARKSGLVVAFRSQDGILHPSCESEGVSLERVDRIRSEEPYFVGAACEPGGGGVTVLARASENVTLIADDGEPFPNEGPFHVARLASGSRRVRLRVARLDGGRILAEYVLRLAPKAAARAAASAARRTAAAPARPVAGASAAAAPEPVAEPSKIDVSVALLPTHLSYGGAGRDGEVDPSEYGLVLDARARFGLAEPASTLWEAEMRLPLLTFVGEPAGLPAGGEYAFAVRAAPASLAWGGAVARFRALAGATVRHARFSRRPDASGFLAGPEAGVELGTRASVTRLLLSPFQRGFGAGIESAFEVLRSGGERRLDFEMMLRYLSVRADGGGAVPALAISTGFRLWL